MSDEEALRDEVARLRDRIEAVREFAYGLGASTATRRQILDALDSAPFAPTAPELAWASRVLPDLLRQSAEIQATHRQPYCVLVDFDTVPDGPIRLEGATILGLPVIHSPGMVEPAVAIRERLPVD